MLNTATSKTLSSQLLGKPRMLWQQGQRALLLAGCIFSMAVQAAAPVSFSYDGESYQGEQLPPAVRQAVYEARLEHIQQLRLQVDQYAVNRFLQEQAKAEEVTPRAIQQRYLAVTEPTAEQVESFYQQNKSRIGAPLQQVQPQLVQLMKNQQLALKQAQLLATLAQEKGYKVSLPEPQAPVFDIATEGYPSKGSDNPEVTVVEFADYQCPHCKDAAATVEILLERYPDIELVYRDYPINSSGVSRKVAEAAVCADQQDQFWPFHDLAFERQQYLKAVQPSQLAEEVGLDMDTFKACYSDPATTQKVRDSLAEGDHLGLTGTPTFFVDGVKVLSQGNLQQALSAAIEQAMSANGK